MIRSSFSIYTQRRWIQFRVYGQCDIEEWLIMIVYELDISALTKEGIQMDEYAFENVDELDSSSIIDWLIMIEMLILLVNSFDRIANVLKNSDIKVIVWYVLYWLCLLIINWTNLIIHSLESFMVSDPYHFIYCS